jgi:hypothetical protein
VNMMDKRGGQNRYRSWCPRHLGKRWRSFQGSRANINAINGGRVRSRARRGANGCRAPLSQARPVIGCGARNYVTLRAAGYGDEPKQR